MEPTKIISEMTANMEHVIIGKKDVIELCIMALLAKGHLLLEDVPGVGKTTLAKCLAKTIDCGFNRIQFTPDTLPSDITGMSIYNMQTGKFEYSNGAIINQIILADEINRTSPKTQASLLEAMEEGQVSVDGTTHELPKPFLVIATQNPIDYLGTYHLPEAQLDRFLMKLSIGYPAMSDEETMVFHYLNNERLGELTPVVDAATILKMQQEVAKVQLHKDLVAYLVQIVDETRHNVNVTLGASPRATLALTRAIQAKAYVSGRNYCTPDDVKAMAEPVLSHRFLLSPDARLNKQTPHTILSAILAKTKVPIL